MVKWFSFVLGLLLLFPGLVLADGVVESELWGGLRVQLYDGYVEEGFTGFVRRQSGDTTTETLGYIALIECGAGDVELCRSVLRWSDENAWVGDDRRTFAWRLLEDGSKPDGLDSASDGDLPLLWGAMRAYGRTGDVEFKQLYDKWSVNILDADVCEKGEDRFLASGSGIGRWDGCHSFNGVYSAYLMLPVLFDLAKYDERFEQVYLSSLKESYDLYTMHGGVLPPRCAGYNGTKMDVLLCETPPYMDYFDAQRSVFWTGMMCNRLDEHEVVFPGDVSLPLLCDHVKGVSTVIGGGFETAQGGYDLSGLPRGNVQFSEFSAALWLPVIEFSRGQGDEVVEKIEDKWNGEDFWGTQCGGRDCIDGFKDALILISMLDHGGRLWVESSLVPSPELIGSGDAEALALCRAEVAGLDRKVEELEAESGRSRAILSKILVLLMGGG